MDVQLFQLNLEDNIFDLYNQLKDGSYKHHTYESFYVSDPKLRHINKACVSDRLFHHAIVRNIEGVFERSFIFDSYSSRKNKGTHRAIERFQKFAWKLSQNKTKTVWVLKCDVRKFFDSVDHEILLGLICKKITDKRCVSLIEEIIRSFHKTDGKGIPLGNVTSQLFSNIYLNELDQFLKRMLAVKYYVRYADDFAILSRDKECLENIIVDVRRFLDDVLELELHPKKVTIEKWHNGIDFLGYVIFPTHVLLRTKTKKRMMRKIRIQYCAFRNKILDKKAFSSILRSYEGMLGYCKNREIIEEVNKMRSGL